MKNIYFIIGIAILIIYVIRSVIKSKLPVKESFFWFIGSLLALLLAIFPTMIDQVAIFLGISYSPSLFFVLCILFLLFMCFRYSRRIAEHQEKIIALGQEIAILKAEQKKVKKPKNKS